MDRVLSKTNLVWKQTGNQFTVFNPITPFRFAVSGRALDKETGELKSPDATALELHKKCFRSEPKWTELKNLGVNDDDFCSREFVGSVKLIKAEVLR